MQQWIDELRILAPSLRVLAYDGWSKVSVPISRASSSNDVKRKTSTTGNDVEMADANEEDDKLMDWCNFVNTFDVCVTTFPTLQQDLGLDRPPPDRPRRSITAYLNVERPRSPHVICEYRVIMGELRGRWWEH